jgi:hypothetical protein
VVRHGSIWASRPYPYLPRVGFKIKQVYSRGDACDGIEIEPFRYSARRRLTRNIQDQERHVRSEGVQVYPISGKLVSTCGLGQFNHRATTDRYLMPTAPETTRKAARRKRSKSIDDRQVPYKIDLLKKEDMACHKRPASLGRDDRMPTKVEVATSRRRVRSHT